MHWLYSKESLFNKSSLPILPKHPGAWETVRAFCAPSLEHMRLNWIFHVFSHIVRDFEGRFTKEDFLFFESLACQLFTGQSKSNLTTRPAYYPSSIAMTSYMYQLQGLLVQGYRPPMVWFAPWKAEATPSYIHTYIHTRRTYIHTYRHINACLRGPSGHDMLPRHSGLNQVQSLSCTGHDLGCLCALPVVCT